jgi:DNA-binding NarL/FixJ family response regulator
MNDATTVFICDDVADIRMLMRFGLEEEGDIRVVGEAEDGVAGVAGVTETQPDVLLLDLSMPELDGLEVIARVRESSPRTGIVVFSGFARERMGSIVLRQGADRYLQKGEPLDAVRAAVLEVARERADEDAA